MAHLISVIMPAYNCEEYVAEAIDSILSQTHANLELLIADDASTDNTKAIIDAYNDPRIKTLHNEKNLGYLRTCNKLFEACKGDFITFQDADDWSSASRLEMQVEAFIKDSELGICGTYADFINPDGSPALISKDYPIDDQKIRDTIIQRNPFCGATLMITRQVYDEIGGYDPFFNRIGNEDYYWAYCIVENYKSLNIDTPHYHVRTNPQSVTRTINHVKQLFSVEIVHFLIEKWRKQGHQTLPIDPNASYLTDFIDQLEQPFKKDASLMYRKEADMRAYYGDIKGSFRSALKAFHTQPFRFINFKYLATTFRRLFLK